MKSKHVLATIAVTAAALTALACGGGSGTKSKVSGGHGTGVATATPAKTTTAKVGQTVTLTSNDLGDKTVVDVTVANAKQYSKEPGAYGDKPEHGVFLVLNVTVLCKDGSYSPNPLNFKFVAKDGAVSETALSVAFTPELEATDLATGQKASGKIVFDVSKAAMSGGRVQIDGVGLDFDAPAAYWSL